MIQVSRIYAIDGVETSIQATADNAQAALRMMENAAEQLGAAPDALPLVKGTGKGKGGKGKAAEPAAPAAAPALPPGVATAFAAPAQMISVGPEYVPAQPDLPFVPSAEIAPDAPPEMHAAFTEAAPVNLGSQTGFVAPPAPVPPPAPPAPPQFQSPQQLSPLELVRGQVKGTLDEIRTLIESKGVKDSWGPAVEQTIRQFAPDPDTNQNEENLRAALGSMRNYLDQCKKSLGVV